MKKDKEKNHQNTSQPLKRPLVKGVDFYIENSLYVFTEHYLKERGYCCDSGCRHCPYKTD